MNTRTRATTERLLIAMDIDGTLCPSGTTDIPDITNDAIADVRAAGHHVVLATGRSLSGALLVAAVLGLDGTWIVASNGAVTAQVDARWPGGYRIESARTLDVEPVLSLARRLCPGARVAVEEIGWGYQTSAPFEPGEVNGRQMVVSDEELILEPAPRVVLSAPNAATLLASPLRALGVTVNQASPSWLDITPHGLSKATALDEVRRHLDVAPESTVFVGDGANDAEAMTWATRSWAMGHAPALVRDIAEDVTGTLAEHGAATVLRALLADGVSSEVAQTVTGAVS
ncbi:HAD family hydrolase [Myceligenerans indicum]|uniref:HAD family phosphatase n=1 Tax=Myceligenerans indicum TaxID=2593663 RepID=A0ABS1LIZ0_9MICO|nr:HAD family hydrolase [Myceligenerans indicum]MBL0886199.1 HAD family phosphatase [Myceligenerans indicum]